MAAMTVSPVVDTCHFEIESGKAEGYLPARMLERVQRWRRAHRDELLSAWELARSHRPLPKIAPLE